MPDSVFAEMSDETKRNIDGGEVSRFHGHNRVIHKLYMANGKRPMVNEGEKRNG